ncbi:MAG: hypothetical protein GY801_06395 [bacterium]|nr:hypothetical protein [bacterium]
MLRLAQLRRTLKKYGIEIQNTKRGRHPIKAVGHNRITGRKLSYPLPAHGKNPEIHDFYLRGLIEKFALPGDLFD